MIGKNKIIGSEFVKQMIKQVNLIREKMKITQDRQKCYNDKQGGSLEFEVRDHVFIRVIPRSKVGRAIKTKKLTPRFIRHFKILQKAGSIAYHVALPIYLSKFSNVLHVSQPRKYHLDPSHVIEPETTELQDNLEYEALPIKLMNYQVNKLLKVLETQE